MLISDPTRETNTNEDQSDNIVPATICDYSDASGPSLASHMNSHTDETVESGHNSYSDIAKATSTVVQSQIPVPKARVNLFSNSQPVNNTSDPNKKRNLSLSPQNIHQHQSNPKNAKITANSQHV